MRKSIVYIFTKGVVKPESLVKITSIIRLFSAVSGEVVPLRISKWLQTSSLTSKDEFSHTNDQVSVHVYVTR